MERKRFKELLKQRGISGRDFAKSVGLEYGSYRSALSRGNCPKWVLAFLVGYDSHENNDDIVEVMANGKRIVITSPKLERFFNFEKYSTPLEYKEYPRRKKFDT